MSRAFVKEDNDALTDEALPERPVSAEPNYVTPAGHEELRAKVEQLRADGVAIANEPHVIFTDDDGIFGQAGADEWMAFITDSEGNLVGLASQNLPTG